MKGLTTIATVGAFLCVAVISAGLAMAGMFEASMYLSLAAFGIVVAGKETDTISDLSVLQQMRNDLAKTIGELRDKFNGRKTDTVPGKFEGVEREQWDARNSEYDAVVARMEELRNATSIEDRWNEINERDERNLRDAQANRDINDPDSSQLREIQPGDRALAMQAWARHQFELDLSEEHVNACRRVGFNYKRKTLAARSHIQTSDIGDAQEVVRAVHRTLRKAALRKYLRELEESGVESRAMSSSTGSGGEFIPQGFMSMLEEALFMHANVRNVVDVWRTDSGNEVPWPTATDQDAGEWLGESAAAGTADPTTANVTFNAYKIGSKVIKVPHELLEDSAFNLLTWLPTIIGRRIGRGLNSACTTGPTLQTDRPAGLVTGSALGHTAAGAGALTYADIVNLEHGVDPLDRANASYMFHDDVLKVLRLILDGDSRPLWTSGMNAGIPDRIHNRPYEINQYMTSSIATTEKPILFGDMSKYKLREVNGFRLYRLEELYRANDQDGFVAFQRFDGKIVNAGTDPIVHLLMP